MAKPGGNGRLIWMCVASYFTAWFVLTSSGFKWKLLAPAFVISAIYAAMHYYEMAHRNHIGLSADSTAIPVTAAATVIGSLAAYAAGISVGAILHFLKNAPVALVLGHIIMFLLVVVAERLNWLPSED